jgi:hypothetical protein
MLAMEREARTEANKRHAMLIFLSLFPACFFFQSEQPPGFSVEDYLRFIYHAGPESNTSLPPTKTKDQLFNVDSDSKIV